MRLAIFDMRFHFVAATRWLPHVGGVSEGRGRGMQGKFSERSSTESTHLYRCVKTLSPSPSPTRLRLGRGAETLRLRLRLMGRCYGCSHLLIMFEEIPCASSLTLGFARSTAPQPTPGTCGRAPTKNGTRGPRPHTPTPKGRSSPRSFGLSFPASGRK